MTSTISSYAGLAGRKILFANFPADGHFNPLTGLAAHLLSLGCDVRWYTSKKYAPAIAALQIPFYPLEKAKDISNIEEAFPARKHIKGTIAKLNFDLTEVFIIRGPEYFADLQDIHKKFPFEVVIADCAFSAIPFITDKMRLPVISIGVLPLTETSIDLPPAGLGMTPSSTFLGKIKQRLLHVIANRVLFSQSNRVMKNVLHANGIDSMNTNVFDLLVKKSTLLLQSGTPGFEYFRSDLGPQIRFIGSLLPHSSQQQTTPWFDQRLLDFDKIVVVTQGTVEKNSEKIIVPTLEAFKNTNTLVIATTGGSGTAELRQRYPYNNCIIADFIPFADIMPYADVYVTNGGYGGVMLGIEHQLPMVVAGIHEGKNEINARVGYFKLGINLKTERPNPAQLKKAVAAVMQDKLYKENLVRLSGEFSGYNPRELCAWYLQDLLVKTYTVRRAQRQAV